jgi:DENN (AEX-3) domain/ENTH domain
VFLYDIFNKHQNLAHVYVSRPSEARNKPVFLTLQDLEVGPEGGKKFAMVDSTHFLLTPPLLIRTSMGELVSNTSNTSILPVLRCLGVAHTLRLLCALLSERRIILISASPTRLATCCKSAIAILAQGLLQWQHLYIPVLPPHLWQYLAAPYPYLIGILASLTPRLDRTDGLGEVLLINLDQNTMETRGMPTDQIEQRIPDLLRNMNQEYSVQALGTGAAPASAPELLAQDLVELLKNDKKTLNGESALASMQDTAVKATKAVKATFFKLKEKSQKYFKQGSYNESDSNQEESEPIEPVDVNPMEPDYIYTEGCRNEMGEEEARLAFCTFFVSMIGNMRWYLSAQPGQPPQLDRQRFLQQKKATGEGEYSTMWPLLHSFCQTQMLEEFAKARIEELRMRQPVTDDSPFFLQCTNYHNTSKIDFSLLSVRRVSRQVLQSNPSRMLQQTNARRMAMELTSKRAFEGDYNKALADLVEQCRECSSVLFDVMSVVWIRMRDNRGLQWRHATHSLHILKNLLFHGPLAAVAEATDGLDKIRALKYYNGNRQASICVQIRTAATQVYNLVVDRNKLFHIRRVCIAKRRSLKKQDQGKVSHYCVVMVPSTLSR